jgi:hypothetical protein
MFFGKICGEMRDESCLRMLRVNRSNMAMVENEDKYGAMVE